MVVTHSCIKEIDDPESTNMSTSFWTKSPQVRSALDLTSPTQTLPTVKDFLEYLSLFGAPQCCFSNSILWLSFQVVQKHNAFLLPGSIIACGLLGGTDNTPLFKLYVLFGSQCFYSRSQKGI